MIEVPKALGALKLYRLGIDGESSQWDLSTCLTFPYSLIGETEFDEIVTKTGLSCTVPDGERFSMFLTINYELRRTIGTATSINLPVGTDPKMKRFASLWAQLEVSADELGQIGSALLPQPMRETTEKWLLMCKNSGGTRKPGRPKAERKAEFYEILLAIFVLIFGNRLAATSGGPACRFMQVVSEVLLRRLKSATGASKEVAKQLRTQWRFSDAGPDHLKEWIKNQDGGIHGVQERARNRVEETLLPHQQAMLTGATPVFTGDVNGVKFTK